MTLNGFQRRLKVRISVFGAINFVSHVDEIDEICRFVTELGTKLDTVEETCKHMVTGNVTL